MIIVNILSHSWRFLSFFFPVFFAIAELLVHSISVFSNVSATSLLLLTKIYSKTLGVDEGAMGSSGVGDLSVKQRHQMKHRELFLSRQVETMPATHIRGKCCVTLLNETESLLSYLNKEDSFFYCLVFDPAQRTLLADKGEVESWIHAYSSD